MNNVRRKKIFKLKQELEQLKNNYSYDNLSRCIDVLTAIRDEEEYAFDSMPEGLQYSSRGMDSEAAIDSMNNALEQLASMPKSDPGDIAGQEKAKAIGDIVRCRETTNQQALRLYEKMYNDLISQRPMSEEKFDLLSLALGDLSRDLTPMQTKEALTEALQIIAKS